MERAIGGPVGTGCPETVSAVAKTPAETTKKGKKDKGGSLGTSRGIETLFKTQYRVNMDLSALADTKSNIMISINGIIISIILASISPVFYRESVRKI